jgi:predicted DCC family thiol-disulfide oxidoreductase YuxK
MPSEPTTQPVLIYDGECRLCLTAKEGLERLAKTRPDQRTGEVAGIRLIPYQTEEAAARLGSEYRPGRPDVAFFVDRHGLVSRGLDAFLPLLPGLPGGRMLLSMMRLPLLRPLGYLLYRLVARYRYRLFGQVPCDIPGARACKVTDGKGQVR